VDGMALGQCSLQILRLFPTNYNFQCSMHSNHQGLVQQPFVAVVPRHNLIPFLQLPEATGKSSDVHRRSSQITVLPKSGLSRVKLFVCFFFRVYQQISRYYSFLPLYF
jgi:hypothetical protein